MKKELSKIGGEKTCPVAVIVKNKRILMGLRHYTPDKWKNISVWTLPGGRCDENENIEKTLRREVREETKIDDLKILKYIDKVDGMKKGDIVPLFLCKTDQDAELGEPEKFSEWKWFSDKEFPENFINPSVLKIIKKTLRTLFIIKNLE